MAKNNLLSLAGVFLLGGLIGAGVAMLTAPMSGPETRSMIRSKSSDLRGRAVDTAEHTRKRANKALDDISSQTKEKVEAIRERGEDMLHDTSKQVKAKIGR
jgi:gas vesicle protein